MKIVVKPGGIFTVLLLTGIFGVTITQNLRPASNRERPATRPAAVAATPAPVLSVPVIDLTSEGILDWKVWGVSPSGENANPMLPIGKSHPIETIGPLKYAGQNQYWSQPALRNMVWSDGDPIRKVLRVGTGVFTTG
ncbi:MAG: hypothetical protein SFU56_11705, partial [Capsulimonadales bacterium]|nr:hypothetical protein [Capsulimonadales bacterium]